MSAAKMSTSVASMSMWHSELYAAAFPYSLGKAGSP